MPPVTDKLTAAARSLRRRFTGWDGLRWMVGVVLALAAGILLSWWFWNDLRADQESLSATVRNLGLVIGGVIAILLAVWRSRVAERQADTAQRGLLNERYQKGAEMLGNAVLSVRLGGIYALQRLAGEHPEQYHVEIMQMFCVFARRPPEPFPEAPPRQGREDVRAVLRAISGRSEAGLAWEKAANSFRLNLDTADFSRLRLYDAKLSGASLRDADFSHAELPGADMSGAHMHHARLYDADFTKANLSGVKFPDAMFNRAKLGGANLEGACLKDAGLSCADLSGCGQNPAIGLTQSQLDKACANENQPPKLDGVVDAETGEPLVWRGKSLPA